MRLRILFTEDSAEARADESRAAGDQYFFHVGAVVFFHILPINITYRASN